MRPLDILDFIWPWARMGSLYRAHERAQHELKLTRSQLSSALDHAKEAEDKLALLRKKTGGPYMGGECSG